MTEQKSSGKLFFYGILLAVLLFGLIRIAWLTEGMIFRLELFGFALLLVLSLIGLVGYAKAWGERVLFFVFLFYLTNLVLVWYFLGSLYMVLLFLALLGFLLSLPKKIEKEDSLSEEPEEPHREVFDVPKKEKEEAEPTVKTTSQEPQEPAAKEVKTKFIPGKLVASIRSNVYHLPRCDWAKKIKKDRQVWFKSKEEAREKGYRAHSCV